MSKQELLDRLGDRVYALVLTAAGDAGLGPEDAWFWEGELTIQVETAVQDAINGT